MTAALADATPPLVSIVVPAYREAENLPVLIPRVHEALSGAGMTGEIIVVDDNSPDATRVVMQKLAEDHPCKLIVRTNERGLSSAVVRGLQEARGTVLVVMDADLSHPPEKVPELVAAILERQGDFVIGSRYVAGGKTDDDWGLFRWLNSKVATWLALPLTSAKDPMAGFFALHRDTFASAHNLDPIGYKIGLELMVKCGCRQVCEIPIHFQDRLYGESKLSLREQLNYLRHLGRLYRHRLGRLAQPLMFLMVGASGMVIDLLLFSVLLLVLGFGSARALAIFGAMTWNFALNRRFTFQSARADSLLRQYVLFCLSCGLGAVVSWSVSNYVWAEFQTVVHYPAVAALAGIAAGVVLNYLLSAKFVFRSGGPKSPSGTGGVQTDAAKSETVEKTGSAAHRVGLASVLLCAALMSSPGLTHDNITGLDQAHNITSSLFFHDALRDLPMSDPVGYTYDYYRQYPALGFTFWPPLYHAATGLVMTVTQPGVIAARGAVFLFNLLLAGCFYCLLRRCASPLLAALATGVMLTSPLLVELENSEMLEIPVLAMCAATLVAYLRLTERGHWTGWPEVMLASGLCAGIVYTKQPGVFLLPALLLDLAWNHRGLLKQRSTWAMLGLVVLLCIPLGLFTLKFGQVNMQQSFGNAGNIYVADHRVADRWSIAGWTYYLREIPQYVNIVVCLLATAGCVWLARTSESRKRYGIWLAYAACWYLLFSLFDNKQPRFITLLAPGLVALGTCLLVEWQRHAGCWAWTAPALLAGMFVWQAAHAHAYVPRGYAGVKELTSELVTPKPDGNLLFFSGDYHLFVPWVRLLDPTHQVYVLRGDDLLEDAGSLSRVLHKFRVRYLLVDPQTPQGEQFRQALAADPSVNLKPLGHHSFDDGFKRFDLEVYESSAPIAAQMSRVPLRSTVQKLAAE